MDVETTVAGAESAETREGTGGTAVIGTGMKISCERDELVAKLGVVSRAVSTRGAVQVLAGILVSAEDGNLTLAATDMEVSLRTMLEAEVEGDGAVVIPGKLFTDLARLLPDPEVTIEYRAEEGVAQVTSGSASYRLNTYAAEDFPRLPELEAIIPARALQELLRLSGGSVGDTVELGVHENHVLFGIGDAWLTSRRIDGQFPNYRQLLPESFEVELTLPRAELHDVVRRISVMAQRNSPLRLRFAEGELTVSAQTQDIGEARETMPVPYSGDDFVIGFNAEFLRDGIDSISGDDVRVKLINPLRPAILEDVGGDYTYLIMPIRLAG